MLSLRNVFRTCSFFVRGPNITNGRFWTHLAHSILSTRTERCALAARSASERRRHAAISRQVRAGEPARIDWEVDASDGGRII